MTPNMSLATHQHLMSEWMRMRDLQTLDEICLPIIWQHGQVAPMSLSAYARQSSLRSSRNGGLIQPSARLSLRRC